MILDRRSSIVPIFAVSHDPGFNTIPEADNNLSNLRICIFPYKRSVTKTMHRVSIPHSIDLSIFLLYELDLHTFSLQEPRTKQKIHSRMHDHLAIDSKQLCLKRSRPNNFVVFMLCSKWWWQIANARSLFSQEIAVDLSDPYSSEAQHRMLFHSLLGKHTAPVQILLKLFCSRCCFCWWYYIVCIAARGLSDVSSLLYNTTYMWTYMYNKCV